MPRRHIIVLLDGTSCTATTGFQRHFSNVFRVGPALAGEQNAKPDPSPEAEIVQADQNYSEKHVLLYFPGPGTRKVPLRELNALTGYETNTIVKEAYLSLCINTVDPSLDKIYIIGFSRGAAAAKVLIALLSKFGLLHRSQVHQFGNLWKAFHEDDEDGEYFSRSAQDIEIEFVGLYDPVSGPQLRKKQYLIDEFVNENIVNAVEILSIDERRRVFYPRFWLPEASSVADVVAGEFTKSPNLQQIWIPGGHGNVGHPENGNVIADIAFLTMIERLTSCTELEVNDTYIDSVFHRLISGERPIEIECKGPKLIWKRRVIPALQSVEIHPLYYTLKNLTVKINDKLERYGVGYQDLKSFGEYHFDIGHMVGDEAGKEKIFKKIVDTLSQERAD